MNMKQLIHKTRENLQAKNIEAPEFEHMLKVFEAMSEEVRNALVLEGNVTILGLGKMIVLPHHENSTAPKKLRFKASEIMISQVIHNQDRSPS